MADLSFGEYIIASRMKNSMSQRALAAKAGVTNSTISRIEANLVKPDPSTLEKLAEALAEDKSLLMTKCGYSEIPEEFILIARRTGELTPEQRFQVYQALNDTIDDVLRKAELDDEDD